MYLCESLLVLGRASWGKEHHGPEKSALSCVENPPVKTEIGLPSSKKVFSLASFIFIEWKEHSLKIFLLSIKISVMRCHNDTGWGKEMDPRHGDKRHGRIFVFDIF